MLRILCEILSTTYSRNPNPIQWFKNASLQRARSAVLTVFRIFVKKAEKRGAKGRKQVKEKDGFKGNIFLKVAITGRCDEYFSE